MIVILAAGGGYYYYHLKSLEALNTYRTTLASPTPTKSALRSSSGSPQAATQESCAQFNTRFGTTAEELKSYINSEPDAAIVMQGYAHVFGKILALPGRENLPFFVTFNSNGKITSFECIESQIAKDYSKDIDFSIPETDFAQIIRYRESLETSQAQSYFQNVTTNPPEAKEIMLERIQGL